MGSETAKGGIEEDSKIVEEAKGLTSSSSARVSSGLDIDGNDCSIGKSKSDGDLSSINSSSGQTPQWSMLSVSPAVGHQITSPPVLQTMAHRPPPSGFDPDRIPASVFSSKTPSGASEWSMASNDSLFSIHMGNSSFTNDVFPRLDEWNSNAHSLYVTEAKSHELCTLPPLMEVPPNEEGSVKSSNVSSLEKEDLNAYDSTSSTHSTTSFAFPVLVNDGGKAITLESVEEKPEVQTQDSIAGDENSTTSRWFSCLSCCPRCC